MELRCRLAPHCMRSSSKPIGTPSTQRAQTPRPQLGARSRAATNRAATVLVCQRELCATCEQRRRRPPHQGAVSSQHRRQAMRLQSLGEPLTTSVQPGGRGPAVEAARQQAGRHWQRRRGAPPAAAAAPPTMRHRGLALLRQAAGPLARTSSSSLGTGALARCRGVCAAASAARLLSVALGLLPAACARAACEVRASASRCSPVLACLSHPVQVPSSGWGVWPQPPSSPAAAATAMAAAATATAPAAQRATAAAACRSCSSRSRAPANAWMP